MSGIANTLRGVASSVMTTQFADPVTFTHITHGAFDTATATTGASSTSTETVNGLVEEYSNLETLAGQTDDPDGLRVGDRKLTVPAASLTTKPTPSAFVTIAGERWQIKKIDEVPAGPTPVLYQIRLRR